MRPALAAIVLLVCCSAGRDELSPMIVAARSGDVAAIRALAACGSDPNVIGGVNGWTPLLHAIHKGQKDSMTALLGAGADPNRSNEDGTTPLIMAAGYGYTDIVQVLLARGADPKLTNRYGATALDMAIIGVADIDRFTVFDCQTETINALRRAGAPSTPVRALGRFKKC